MPLGFAVVPEGYTLADLEKLFPVPSRKRGTITYRDAASFCAAVKLDGDSETTRLYCNPLAPSFKAVFNDHGTDAGWRDHVALYSCPLSVEWKTWTGQNKKQMSQEAFAQFRLQHARQHVADVVQQIVDDRVIADVDMVAPRHFARLRIGTDVEADDHAARSTGQRDIALVDATHGRMQDTDLDLVVADLAQRLDHRLVLGGALVSLGHRRRPTRFHHLAQ